MRLWTFQSKSVLRVLEDGVWYSKFTPSSNVKLIDMKYVKEDFKLDNGEFIDIAPIYCLASFNGKCFKTLSLQNFCSNFDYLFRYIKDINNYVMVELEISDDQVLNVKLESNPYKAKIEGSDSYQVVDEDKVCYNNFLDYIRYNRIYYNVECIIESINKYNVVAIREFSFSSIDSTVIVVDTIYHNDILCPTFKEKLYIDKDNNVYSLSNNTLVKLDSNNFYELQCKYGMDNFYSYYTVGEVLSCCNESVYNKMQNRIKELGLIYKDDNVSGMLISKLFPNGII